MSEIIYKSLHDACRDGDADSVKSLVGAGAISTPDDVGLYPLHYLMLTDAAIETVRNIICSLKKSTGFDMNQLSEKEGIAALHLACSLEDDKRSFEMVELMVTEGADFSIQDGSEHNTPLLIAILEDKAATATYLAGIGSSASVKNSHDQTPVTAAANKPNMQDVIGIFTEKMGFTRLNP